MKMNRQTEASLKVDELYASLLGRKGASCGCCPVETTAAFVSLCLSQSCGKCTPCRVGLDRLNLLLNDVLDGRADMNVLAEIRNCAKAIYDSADCAIGFEAAKLVLDGFDAFRDDYLSHISDGVCTENFRSVPCMAACPAHVDVPGYIALTSAGRYADALRVIRNDNPFPSACGLVCEHPCENKCRRNTVDSAINIRGIKRVASEKAGNVPAPECRPANGKKVAVIGGGPSGLTAAYYLTLKGFKVTVYEKHKKLGGMLRYGIPVYRLPDEGIDRDINSILSTGIDVKYETEIGKDISFDTLRKENDAVYIAIGAQGSNKLRIDGENAEGVLSAVTLLGDVGEGLRPDFSGKRVCIVGGGNDAMDATRTSMRLGAASVTCVYRRRIDDMTALPDEITGAMAEGCEIMQLMSPVRVAAENGKVTGLVVKPQIPGEIKGGRPAPVDSSLPEETIPCDIVITAIGQSIESGFLAGAGVELNRGRVCADSEGAVRGTDGKLAGVFTGGDCMTGPSTVINAIMAGKTAAENIADYLGVNVDVREDIDIPDAPVSQRLNWGRVNMREEAANERKHNFGLMEKGMTDEESAQECSRCLRCDHFGCAAFRNGGKR